MKTENHPRKIFIVANRLPVSVSKMHPDEWRLNPNEYPEF